jgi:hypothetical protein
MMDNNKYAVIIATYKRKDKSSLNNLKRISDFLKNQTYQNFKIFLVGDDYDDIEEFKKAVEFFPKNKIFSYNNPHSYRIGYFKKNINKWASGGISARFKGISEAMSQDFQYYIHLDDDDIWENNHIEEINNITVKYPNVDFMVSKSNYLNGILPGEYMKLDEKKVDYNNFIPTPCNSVHSSWTINLKTLGEIILKLYKERIDEIEQIKNGKIKEYVLSPFDASILKLFNNLQKKGEMKSIYIPKCTVTKKTDCNIPA